MSKKLSHEYINEYYNKYNYILKSVYKNCMYSDILICPVGHEIKMKFNNFQQGKRCGICHFKNRGGKNHYKYNSDRSRKLRLNYLRFDLYHIDLLRDEVLFENYLTSKNQSLIYGKAFKNGFTVDHIFPRVAFIDNDLDLIYEPKIVKKICNLRENLRIILEQDNTSKGGKYNQEQFLDWFNRIINSYI